MPRPTPKTVLMYPNGTVYVLAGHINPHTQPSLTYMDGNIPPQSYYHVVASGQSVAIAAALIQATKLQEATVPEYKLILGEQSDKNVHALAAQLGITTAEVITRAINTYSTIKAHNYDDVFLRARTEGGKYVVKRLIVP